MSDYERMKDKPSYMVLGKVRSYVRHVLIIVGQYEFR